MLQYGAFVFPRCVVVCWLITGTLITKHHSCQIPVCTTTHPPQLVASWQPWWQSPAATALQLGPQGTPLVQPLETTPDKTTPGKTTPDKTTPGKTTPDKTTPDKTAPPAVLPEPPSEPLPTLRTLLPRQPHPSLRWQLLQLLYSYCLVVRVHVGDWEGDEAHAAQAVVAGAPPLGLAHSTAAPTGARDALTACMEAAMQPPLAVHTTRSFAIALLEVRVLLDAC